MVGLLVPTEVLVEKDVDELGRRAGVAAMRFGDRKCDLLALVVGGSAVGDASVERHDEPPSERSRSERAA